MKKLWITTFSTLLSGLAISSVFAANAMPAGSASAGQTTATTVCAACHGADGNSMVPTFPRLAGQNPNYIFKQLNDFKAGRRTNATMAPMAMVLDEQGMANVASYYSTQKASVSLSTDGASYDSGERLYRGGDGTRGVVPCSGCHGPKGKGNNLAAFPKVGGQHPDYIKAQLTAFRAAGRGDLAGDKRTNDGAKAGEPGMMQMVASKLSDQDIANLANFLAGLH